MSSRLDWQRARDRDNVGAPAKRPAKAPSPQQTKLLTRLRADNTIATRNMPATAQAATAEILKLKAGILPTNPKRKKHRRDLAASIDASIKRRLANSAGEARST